jgi:PTH1 family peptidyl-tRNA hydrolase
LLGRFFGNGRPRKVDEGGGPVAVKVGNGGINIKKFKPDVLIAGLGNPGDKYGGTRHNVGFDVTDALCASLGEGNVTAPEEYCEALCRAAFFGAESGKRALVVKPLTYMNLSGDSVGALAGKYGLGADRCLIIVDDFQLPLGKLRFRKDGSPGGHNGLKSVEAALGSAYPRLRVGIGPLPPGAGVIDFVLGKFEESERVELEKAVKAAAVAVTLMVDSGIDVAMNRYN